MIIKSLYSKHEETFILERAYFLLKELVLFFQNGNFSDEIKKDWENRAGGYLCIFGEKQYDVQLWAEIGIIRPEKENKYIFYSREKGERLFVHLPEGHVTSFESQREEKNEFGGAIFARPAMRRYSFSGLPERDRGDSILMLALAILQSHISHDDAVEISREILETENFFLFSRFIENKRPYFFH
ncbi:MAG: hypothetical protein Athens071416_10 [Parcubacteria group bacterium Athens0714_16]|nr:MAG: hypothetical protein Athens071416_10 [Parcubacteria group bacterium Athens0714_16]